MKQSTQELRPGKHNASGAKFRRWSRLIHRDLSFFFSGILLIYAISGFVMNHRDAINPHYSVEVKEVQADRASLQGKLTKEDVLKLLTPLKLEKQYTKHYYPKPEQLKVFLKGGSSLVLDQTSGTGTLELLSKRHLLSEMTKLHYNPGSWWTWFSDIFCFSLIVIVVTGFTMMKGSKGLLGRGGIELLLGILIPILFIVLTNQ
ncbi:MAG: PepSY-associated TM helix domain-containing protein [Bacteroidales bacterium]